MRAVVDDASASAPNASPSIRAVSLLHPLVSSPGPSRFSKHSSDVFLQVPGADPPHGVLSRPHSGLLHPQMWTGHLPGRAGLLRAGQRHHRGHLLQAVRGPDLLPHRHGDPETFRGAHHAAPVRGGILCSAGVVLQVQAAHTAARRTPARHHVAGPAGGELHTGQLAGAGSLCSAALV